ncbi:MAG: molybdenum cofactor guanylyltransferase [Planctomycetota bacterium]
MSRSSSPLHCVILAGGRSRRMGRRKEWICIGGVPLIELHLRRWRPLFREVWISCSDPEGFRELFLEMGARPLVDPPGLPCLRAIIEHCAESVGEGFFLVAVDLPALEPEVVKGLIELRRPGEGVMPRSARGLEPLAALYDPSCLEGLRAMREGRIHKLSRIPQFVPTRVVDWPQAFPAELAGENRVDPFLNLNTPEDLARYERQPAGGS